MNRKKRSLLHVEACEDRTTPAITRTIGTLQVVDTAANPNYEWRSQAAANLPGTVVGTNTLRASLNASWKVTGADLANVTKTGLWVFQEIWWLDSDPYNAQVISKDKFRIAIFTTATGLTEYTESATMQFSAQITNDQYKDEINTVWHQGKLHQHVLSPTTFRIDLTSVAANPGNQGGNQGGLRDNSGLVNWVALGLLPSPDLPTLPTGGYYRLLSFDSPNGTDFMFTATNSTGYGMFAASSPDLIEDDDGNWVLDQATTLNPVVLGGASTAGAYNGSNRDLVLRPNAGGEPLFLTGYTYSAIPNPLLSLGDGQSATVDGNDIEEGDEMLWLNYDDGSAMRRFVLLPNTSSSPQLTVSDVTVTEGNSGTTNATFTVTLSAAASANVTVQYATVAGTASASSDFTSTSGAITFTPGQTSKTVTIAVNGDTTFEPNEDFFLSLSGATNAVIADSVGLGTIVNDDSQPTISINNVTQVEGHSGSTTFIFTVTLSNPSWQTISVSFSTTDGSAAGGQDYQSASGALTFNPGETTKTIVITVYGDTTVEQSLGGSGEGFFVNLSNATNSSIGIGQGVGFIEDDD